MKIFKIENTVVDLLHILYNSIALEILRFPYTWYNSNLDNPRSNEITVIIAKCNIV